MSPTKSMFSWISGRRIAWLMLGVAFMMAVPLFAQDAAPPAADVPAAVAPAAEAATEAAATAVDAAAAATPEEPVAMLPQSTANIMWLCLTAFLVFFMQAGFAMVESGLTRSKNACNIMMKNLLDFCFGAIVFWLIGYSLMYGDNGNAYVGWNWSFFGMGGMTGLESGADSAAYLFQVVFAATAATIVSGAMAERTKLISYIFYSILISAVVYPISGHWIWGPNGWLAGMGMRDFAGSTVVHSVGAWASLAGAIMVGPRLGKYNADGSANAIPGHNMPLAALGVFILWFGWYGFNPGSTLTAVDGIAHVAVTTTLAASAGAIGALVISWVSFGKPDLSMTLNGTLAGLVAITAPCASVSNGSAIIIGLCAGVLVFCSCLFIEKKLKIDDPVGAISVHGVCGAFGTLCVGLFGEHAIDAAYWSEETGIKDGLFMGGGFHQFGVQLIGVAVVFVFAFTCAMILFAVLKATIGLRVSDAEQIEGLDLGEHDAAAYPDFAQTFVKSYHLREA